MGKKTLCCILSLAASSLVHSQTPAAFLGTWAVKWQGQKRQQEARLVITEQGGTWKAATYPRIGPCFSREAPIALEEANGEKVTVHLKFSEALHGCEDVKIRIKKLNDQALTGTWGQAELAITRAE